MMVALCLSSLSSLQGLIWLIGWFSMMDVVHIATVVHLVTMVAATCTSVCSLGWHDSSHTGSFPVHVEYCSPSCYNFLRPCLLHPGGESRNFNGNVVWWLFYLHPVRWYVQCWVMYLGVLKYGPGDFMTILLVTVRQ